VAAGGSQCCLPLAFAAVRRDLALRRQRNRSELEESSLLTSSGAVLSDLATLAWDPAFRSHTLLYVRLLRDARLSGAPLRILQFVVGAGTASAWNKRARTASELSRQRGVSRLDVLLPDSITDAQAVTLYRDACTWTELRELNSSQMQDADANAPPRAASASLEQGAPAAAAATAAGAAAATPAKSASESSTHEVLLLSATSDSSDSGHGRIRGASDDDDAGI
jgi:hypothetical protein